MNPVIFVQNLFHYKEDTIKQKEAFPKNRNLVQNCSGKGCRVCSFHGISEFDSVEGKISQYLFSKFDGTTAKFTWIGGDDKSSLVLGSGRPFFVKIQNPLKRSTILPKKINVNSVHISNLKIISETPKTHPKFTSLIELQINSLYEIDSKSLKKLKNIVKDPVIVYEKSGKRSEKNISTLKYKKNLKKEFYFIG